MSKLSAQQHKPHTFAVNHIFAAKKLLKFAPFTSQRQRQHQHRRRQQQIL